LTIPGTRSHRCFIPAVIGELKISRKSADCNKTTSVKTDEHTARLLKDIRCGQDVAVIYDQDWYLGSVVEISAENEDILVNFLQPRGPARSFSWPRRRDECWVPLNHVLAVVSDLLTATGHRYNIHESTERHIQDSYNSLVQVHFSDN